VTVKALLDDIDAPMEQEWTDANACLQSSSLQRTGGGYLGFTGGHAHVDDLTVDGWDESAWKTEMVEKFDVNANGYAARSGAVRRVRVGGAAVRRYPSYALTGPLIWTTGRPRARSWCRRKAITIGCICPYGHTDMDALASMQSTNLARPCHGSEVLRAAMSA